MPPPYVKFPDPCFTIIFGPNPRRLVSQVDTNEGQSDKRARKLLVNPWNVNGDVICKFSSYLNSDEYSYLFDLRGEISPAKSAPGAL